MRRLSITLQTMMRSLRMMTDNSEDPRYTEEKLLLRASCFRSLLHHLEEHTTIDNIEQGFQDYLRSYVEKAYGKS